MKSDKQNMSIEKMIMYHIGIIEQIKCTSLNIQEAAADDKIEVVFLLVDNRDRLINIADDFQTKIQLFINQLTQDNLIGQFKSLINTWAHEVGGLLDQTNLLNDMTEKILMSKKEQVSTEISSIHNTRKAYKGYNLRNVRR